MPKTKYFFNRKTLTFEKQKVSLKKRVVNTLLFLTASLMMAVIGGLLFSKLGKTPKFKQLEREKGEIISQYNILQDQLNHYESVLADIQLRDDKVYRSVFELDPIPSTVREAGFGGVKRYSDLEGYSSSDVMINTFSQIDKISKKIYVQSKSFDNIVDLALQKEKMLASIPAIQPISIKDFNRISDYYGMRNDPFNKRPTMHYGMDFTGPLGSEIYATGDGEIIEAGYNLHGYGNRVIINHGFGYVTIYAHLRNIKVSPGDKVKRGDVIGTLGNTGRSTGPHLHYEIRLNNKPKNPINYYFNDLSEEEFEKMLMATSKSRTPMD